MIETSLSSLMLWKTAIIAVWFACFFVIERLKPLTPWKLKDSNSLFSQPRHLATNGGLLLINSLLAPLLVLPVTMFAISHQLEWRSEIWSTPGSLIVDLVLLDLWIYTWHRGNHQIPFLWRFHQVHHFDQQLDSSSAFRFHFGELVLSALVRAPLIIVMGISWETILIFETLLLVAAVFHHGNIPLPGHWDKRLALLIITPGIHWVHHHAVVVDTDSNYGTLLSVWDRIFASRSSTVRTAEMPLGIENDSENRFVYLLLKPFFSLAGKRANFTAEKR